MVKLLSLKTKSDFDRLRKEGLKWVATSMVIRFSSFQESQARLGLAASKKLGNAVIRNRAKRRLKEAFRLVNQETSLKAGDYLVSPRAGAFEKPFADLKKDVEWSLKHLYRLDHDKQEKHGAEPHE